MSQEKDYSQDNQAILNKWRHEEERKRMSAQHAEKTTKDAIANMLKREGMRSSVARDLKEAVSNPSKHDMPESGFRQDEHVTGYEDRYWEKD